ncbi:MAG: tetratricopeptide repeat protein [Planctomycetaceae bacterium]|nr:tetratricopeptide repeat protein [Planctomycetaceae bacterium]
MPYVVNGTGTWYYGKNRVHRISGTCPNCNAYAELPSYDTTKYLTVLFIPLIPLSKWRVLEECPSCGKHRALKLKQWEESKAEDSRHVTEELRQNPDSPEAIQKVMAVAAMYQDEQLFLKIADTLAKPMTYDAGVQAQLGHAYAYFSRLSDAEEAFRASLAVKHDPDVAEALALQLLRQGRPDEAHSELQHCLKSDEAKHAGFVYLLGEGYLANGQPDRALELFDQATTMDASIAADKQYQKLRKRAEKLRGTGKSIPSALLTPSKKAGYEEGGKGGKVAAWVGPLVALVLLAWYLGYAWSLGNEREVFVVNGLNAPLSATVGGTSVELQPQGRRAIKIPEGTVHVTATTGGKSVIDEDLELHTSFFARPFISPTFIINPDQTALLTWEKQYYAEDVADAPEGEWEYHVGQPLYEFRGLDFEFLPFPGQIQMGGSSKYVSRTRVDTVRDLSDEDLVFILPDTLEEAELTTYLRRRAEFEPGSEFWIAFASSKMPDEEFLSFIREGLEDRPVRIAWHRFYQSKMEELHPEHDLEAEYQSFLAADPENADLIYLSGRAMTDIDASLALFRRAAEAAPPLCVRCLCTRLLPFVCRRIRRGRATCATGDRRPARCAFVSDSRSQSQAGHRTY